MVIIKILIPFNLRQFLTIFIFFAYTHTVCCNSEFGDCRISFCGYCVKYATILNLIN